jgi:YVTN family beta-propeller protein
MGDKRHVLITNRVENTVAIIDQQTLKVTEKFHVPGGPDCMELTRDGRELWVTSRFRRQVTVVDMATKKIIAEIPVGRSPHGVYFRNHASRQ